MAKLVLSGDGMTLELPDELVSDDDKVRQALSPHYPGLANAHVSRQTVNGVLTITVTRQAGTKGGPGRIVDPDANADPGADASAKISAGEYLEKEAPPYINPAFALAWHLQRYTISHNGRLPPPAPGPGPNPVPRHRQLQGEASLHSPSEEQAKTERVSQDQDQTQAEAEPPGDELLANLYWWQDPINQALLEGERENDQIKLVIEALVKTPAVVARNFSSGVF